MTFRTFRRASLVVLALGVLGELPAAAGAPIAVAPTVPVVAEAPSPVPSAARAQAPVAPRAQAQMISKAPSLGRQRAAWGDMRRRGTRAVACPAGSVSLNLRSNPSACRHIAKDVPGSNQRVRTAATAPKCYGNGVNGPRVQLVYAYGSGRPNRARTLLPKFANEIAPRMETVFRKTSREQGRELGLRFHAPGCKLSVDVIQIPSDIVFADDLGSQAGGVMDYLYDNGYGKSDRKYHVWLDAPAAQSGVCGISPLAAIPVAGDNPTPVNLNNTGSTPVISYVAITYRSASKFGNVDDCWGRGGTGARTEVHELLHSLGAVQPGSPNSNGAGHCQDDVDIMCYTEGSKKTRRRCEVKVELLDCGSDDYFHASPPAGSYLSTHWNVASSMFLGDALGIDLIPLVLPRP